LFQVSLTNLIKNKFEFLWQKSISPSEFDSMAYWEFEEYIKLMNERNKEENDKSQNQQQEQNSYKDKMTPKMPNLSNFKPGNFKPPKL
jgi:hypothetical protein